MWTTKRAILIAILSLTTTGCGTRVDHEFAEEVSAGWVVLEIGNASCPPLEETSGNLRVVVDASRRGCTSSEIQTHRPRVYHLDGEGVRRRLSRQAVQRQAVVETTKGDQVRRYYVFWYARDGETPIGGPAEALHESGTQGD